MKVCVVCGRKATEVHHYAGRAGKLLLEESLWLAICRSCHTDIHNQPTIARHLGLLAPLGVWNDPTKAIKANLTKWND